MAASRLMCLGPTLAGLIAALSIAPGSIVIFAVELARSRAMTMMNEKKTMRLHCGQCETTFNSGIVMPEELRIVATQIKEARCPVCGAGSKRLFFRGDKDGN